MFVQSQVSPCVCHIEDIFLLVYVSYHIMFRTSKDKIGTVYEYLFIYYKIEDDGKLNKYIGVELDH